MWETQAKVYLERNRIAVQFIKYMPIINCTVQRTIKAGCTQYQQGMALKVRALLLKFNISTV
jgi:hypothetical protein